MRHLIGLTLIAITLALSACSAPSVTAQNLPAGDAVRGAALFTQSIDGQPACTSCHSVDGSASTGPSLKGFSAAAGSRVPNMNANAYALDSIVQPAASIVTGYSNVMFGQYGQHLSPQQLSDLIAYLLTL